MRISPFVLIVHRNFIGAVIGALGGTVSVGASIAESVYRTKACKEAGELLNKFQQTRKNIVDSCSVIIDKLKQEGFENRCLTVITRQIGGQGGISIAELMHTNVSATKQVGEPATKCVLEFAGTAGRVASAMNKMTCATTKAIHMAGGFFGISVIAVDIRSLYRSVHAVSSDQLPETAKQICDLAEKLLDTCPSDREIDEMIEDILQRL
ncbi:hypothetical protein DPMN_023703 [Dreissena polymorpha]|uniref:Uncharacterized protein n=1 Tax=Dreissena polymorpha TaxID=45954 RepID=A0A9D4LMV8_DREPO|nr:hypothetical protein DPMN_023703 [Dreissena polymorpha]